MPASVAGPPGGWHVPAESPSLQGQLFLMLRSASPVTSTLPLFVDTGPGYSPVPDRIVRLTPRGVASIAWLGPAPPRRFALASPSSMPVCLRQLELVVIQAR
jgi:hypothetical protein